MRAPAVSGGYHPIVVIGIGEAAPPIAGVDRDRAHALVFFKVTCSTTQIAAPALERLGVAYPGRVTGIAQDPPHDIEAFGATYGIGFPMLPDLSPYEASNAYGISVAPTVVVVDGDGRVADVAVSWDREAHNRASAVLAGLLGVEPIEVSRPGDGLPDFKPG
jgi:hypothetical protein